MKSLVVGEQPPGYDVGDAYHYILMRILMAARAYDKQAIDGPYLAIKDLEGYRRVAGRSAALGFDGKWVLHPDQVAEYIRACGFYGGVRAPRLAPGERDYFTIPLCTDCSASAYCGDVVFTVPSALATCVTETILVRPDSSAVYCSKMISPRSLTGITRIVAPVAA